MGRYKMCCTVRKVHIEGVEDMVGWAFYTISSSMCFVPSHDSPLFPFPLAPRRLVLFSWDRGVGVA